MVYKICKITNYNFDDIVVDTEERLGKDKNYLLDSKKIRNEMEWNESINLEDGIKDTINSIDSNLIELKKLPSSNIYIKNRIHKPFFSPFNIFFTKFFN